MGGLRVGSVFWMQGFAGGRRLERQGDGGVVGWWERMGRGFFGFWMIPCLFSSFLLLDLGRRQH